MKDKIFRYAGVVFLLVFMVVCILAYIVFEQTLLPVWALFAMAFSGVCVSWPLLGRRWAWLVGADSRWFQLACHVAVTGLLAASLPVLVNYYVPSDGASVHGEEVFVENKTMTSHRKTRRVGRHHYVADGVRYEYYIGVVFDDGTRKDIPVSRSVYNRTRNGAKTVLQLRRGFLGFTVVDRVG